MSRLKVLKHQGLEILYADFSEMTQREEGAQLLALLVEELKLRPENSVRLLINTTHAVHDSKQANDWKGHQPLFDSRVLRSAVYGLSALNAMAYAGYRMAAQLMGQQNPEKLGRHFSSHDKALEYLVSK